MTRDKATAILARMIDDAEAGRFPVRVREIYVLGSYLRGALSPNDLDVILIHEPAMELLRQLEENIKAKYNLFESLRHSPSNDLRILIRKVFCKPGERVDLFVGHSLDGALGESSLVKDAPRMLVWSDSDRDWQGKLRVIVPDPTAGSFERGCFVDLHRYDCGFGLRGMRAVSDSLERGEILLKRTPLEELQVRLNPGYQTALERWTESHFVGRAATKLLPFALYWIQQQRGQRHDPPYPPVQLILRSRDNFYTIYLGKPPIICALNVLDTRFNTKKVAMLPFLKRGKANEILEFTSAGRGIKPPAQQLSPSGDPKTPPNH